MNMKTEYIFCFCSFVDILFFVLIYIIKERMNVMKQKLESLVTELKDGNVSIDVVADCMYGTKIQETISNLVAKYKDLSDITDADDYQTIVWLLELAYYIYTYSDKYTGMSDSEYDVLYAVYENTVKTQGKEEFITLPLIDSGKTTDTHKYPLLRGTLQKVHYLKEDEQRTNKSRKSLDEWIYKTESLYKELSGNEIDLRQEEVYVFPKWDGVSTIFEFGPDGDIEKALTRGFTKLNTAENITRHFKGMTRSLNGKPYGLKTEIMCKEEDVITYNMIYDTDYKQSRSIVSGLLNSIEPDSRNSYLQIMQLRYMEEGDTIEKLCPDVFNHPYLRCRLGDVDAIEKFASEHKFTEGLRCDGAVIHIINPEIQSALGRENDKNRFECAYKFTEEHGYSKVEDVEFQVGLFGTVTPVVKFKPIELKGNTIESASLGSMARFDYMKLRRGDKLKILYDIIPYAIYDNQDPKCKRSNEKRIKAPKDCPSCGVPLTREGAMLMCKNPDCDCRKKGKILNYIGKMNIKNIGFSTISSLYDANIVRSIEDLYRLEDKKEDIIAIHGIGEGVYDDMIHQINIKRSATGSVLLGAVGISGIGETTFRKVLNIYTMGDLVDFAENNGVAFLSEVNGIGDKKATQIMDGVKENLPLIEFLLDELDVVKEENKGPVKFSVCFTNVRDEELNKWIEEKGGKVDQSITKSTSYLVVPMIGVTSGKVTKAKEYNIPIIEIDDLKSRVEKDYRF